jgi:hypothetical protein
MRSSFIALALAALAVGAAGLAAPRLTPGQAAVVALPAAGKPQRCVQLRQVRRTTPVGQQAIMFETGMNTWLRNDLPASCPANRDRILVIRSTIGSLCQGDIVDVVDPVSRIGYGSCVLGPYTPVSVPKGLKF